MKAWTNNSIVWSGCALLALACRSSSAANPIPEPVRITREGSTLVVVPAPTLRQSMRHYFPGYGLPPLTAFDPELRKGFSRVRPLEGEPAMSFVGVGDFDGNGLPDVALFLRNRQNQWLLVAFHQTYRGTFRPYRLARRKPLGLFDCWITRHPPGRLRSYMSEGSEDNRATARSKHDWIEEEDDEATENFGYYFEKGRYRSAYLG
jgi:hypothetical protein